jgi:hypothetical protein
LLSFESTNDVWGRCTNPHNNKYSPGGSTGGEAALLAAGGGRIGIGSGMLVSRKSLYETDWDIQMWLVVSEHRHTSRVFTA